MSGVGWSRSFAGNEQTLLNPRAGRKAFFSEEKAEARPAEPKDFSFWRSRIDPVLGLDRGTGGEIKVFCFFSSEKKILFC
jgi:hypothetical protein